MLPCIISYAVKDVLLSLTTKIFQPCSSQFFLKHHMYVYTVYTIWHKDLNITVCLFYSERKR